MFIVHEMVLPLNPILFAFFNLVSSVCVSVFVFVFVFSFEGLVCVWFAEGQVTGLLSRGRVAGAGEDK